MGRQHRGVRRTTLRESGLGEPGPFPGPRVRVRRGCFLSSCPSVLVESPCRLPAGGWGGFVPAVASCPAVPGRAWAAHRWGTVGEACFVLRLRCAGRGCQGRWEWEGRGSAKRNRLPSAFLRPPLGVPSPALRRRRLLADLGVFYGSWRTQRLERGGGRLARHPPSRLNGPSLRGTPGGASPGGREG